VNILVSRVLISFLKSIDGVTHLGREWPVVGLEEESWVVGRGTESPLVARVEVVEGHLRDEPWERDEAEVEAEALGLALRWP